MDAVTLASINISHRWRVEKRAGRYILRDEMGTVWKNGATLYSSGSWMGYEKEILSISEASESEAWAHLPKSGYTILPPETPLYHFRFKGTAGFHITIEEMARVENAFKSGEAGLVIHTLTGASVLIDIDKHPALVFSPSP